MITKETATKYFIGIIPSSSCCTQIAEYKQQLYLKNKIKNGEFKLPVIQLIPPFEWAEKEEYLLIETLKKYASQSYSLELEFNNFEMIGCDFSFIITEKEQIRMFQKSLQYFLEIQNKLEFDNYSENNFEPHLFMNICVDNSRKLSKIWTHLKENPFQINFIANTISLIACKHDNYELVREFELE